MDLTVGADENVVARRVVYESWNWISLELFLRLDVDVEGLVASGVVLDDDWLEQHVIPAKTIKSSRERAFPRLNWKSILDLELISCMAA